MKNEPLLSSKDKSKKLKCLLLQFFFGALRVNRSTEKLLSFIALTCINTNQTPFQTKLERTSAI